MKKYESPIAEIETVSDVIATSEEVTSGRIEFEWDTYVNPTATYQLTRSISVNEMTDELLSVKYNT